MSSHLIELLSARVGRWWSNPERGASAVEYGLLIAGIAAVIATAVWAYSGTVVELFEHTCTHITSNLNNSTQGCIK